MPELWGKALLVVAAYLSGSVPFGVLLTRHLPGVDVRTQGSGNIGATNVARVAGKKLGLRVLALDTLKGLVPALAARWLFPGQPWLHAAVALAAILGHVFSCFLRLRGGKGVATALGGLLVIAPWAALAGAAVYLLVFAISRISSVGSLLGALAALATAFLLPGPRPYAWFTLAVLLLLVWTHRANIGRMWRRAEKAL